MKTSRNPSEFFKRRGIVPMTRNPAPRLKPGGLLVNFVKVLSSQPQTELLVPLEGDPAPDRGKSVEWK